MGLLNNQVAAGSIKTRKMDYRRDQKALRVSRKGKNEIRHKRGFSKTTLAVRFSVERTTFVGAAKHRTCLLEEDRDFSRSR